MRIIGHPIPGSTPECKILLLFGFTVRVARKIQFIYSNIKKARTRCAALRYMANDAQYKCVQWQMSANVRIYKNPSNKLNFFLLNDSVPWASWGSSRPQHFTLKMISFNLFNDLIDLINIFYTHDLL